MTNDVKNITNVPDIENAIKVKTRRVKTLRTQGWAAGAAAVLAMSQMVLNRDFDPSFLFLTGGAFLGCTGAGIACHAFADMHKEDVRALRARLKWMARQAKQK